MKSPKINELIKVIPHARPCDGLSNKRIVRWSTCEDGDEEVWKNVLLQEKARHGLFLLSQRKLVSGGKVYLDRETDKKEVNRKTDIDK